MRDKIPATNTACGQQETILAKSINGRPKIFLIGGPNGAGKTTSAFALLPQLLDCSEYINADAIASGLSPFQPETVSLQAGKLMVRRISELAAARASFAFETTMASRSFAPFLARCRNSGYLITIAYVFLDSPHLAVQRVRERVAAGGHHVAKADIIRRYHAGRRNFLQLYLPLANHWYAFNNSGESPALIACNSPDGTVAVLDDILWQRIQRGTNGTTNGS